MLLDISHDLAARLARAERPLVRERLPGARWDERARTSPSLRRAIPARVIAAWGARRGQRAWVADAAARAAALRAAEAILAGTHRAGEVEQIARARLVHQRICDALLWQPRLRVHLEPEDEARLQVALASGRGVVLSGCHLMPFFESAMISARYGRPSYVVAAPFMFGQPADGVWGRRTAHLRNRVRMRGCRLVESRGSADLLKALLGRGEVVFLAFDMPGSWPAQMLGKQVMLASGTARLAYATNALVLPVRTQLVGHRVFIRVAAPLDPSEINDPRALHEALAAHHAAWILATPEALEDPCRDGAWERGATARAWVRPRAAGAGLVSAHT
jgi:lauroyl/myristoyl acyltransferase